MKGFFVMCIILALCAGYFLYSLTAKAPLEILETPNKEVSAARGHTYVNASADIIRILEPHVGAAVSKTFTVKGVARGMWYFEASFPIVVTTVDGTVLVTTPAVAESDWMTTEFVPFSAAVLVPAYTGPAIVILKKDNPSGDPERDASVSFPITLQ